MGALIVVSHEHSLPTPIQYNLGNHTLIITHDYSASDAFELAAPRIEEAEEANPGEEQQPALLIFDHDEAYYLYQCLHMLFTPAHASDAEREEGEQNSST